MRRFWGVFLFYAGTRKTLQDCKIVQVFAKLWGTYGEQIPLGEKRDDAEGSRMRHVGEEPLPRLNPACTWKTMHRSGEMVTHDYMRDRCTLGPVNQKEV